MSSAAIKEYAQFFRDFIELCLLPEWPDDDDEPEKIRNVLEIARHVEESVNKMKTERKCFDKFLDLLCVNQNFTKVLLKSCMTDPPKFILRKIINSECDVNQIDVAFKNFNDLFTEERLVESLSELMVEAASKETLLKNMSIVLPPHKALELKNQIYLFVILECDSDEIIVDTLKDCNCDMIDSLVLCLIRDNMVGFDKDDMKSVKRKIVTGFTNVMSCRDSSARQFWELLLNVDKENLIEMCLKYNTFCEMIYEALKDNYIQIMNNLPLESYYINFTEDELYLMIDKIFENATLKFKFLDYIKDYEFDERCLKSLYERIVASCEHKIKD